ncbi:hypothetical protein E4U54_005137 [Claviceps lovelessii]|nr:hypothetical protein E4U54_005137 [Claviceps lovelessii]
MSLFGTSPTERERDAHPSSSLSSSPSPSPSSSPASRRQTKARGGGLFDDDLHKASSSSLFDDGHAAQDSASSPWDMPAPRSRRSRRDMVRSLLPTSDVPDSYIEVFDAMNRDEGGHGRIRAGAISKLFANAGLDGASQTHIMALLAPGVESDDVSLEQDEVNVLLAMVALGQEGEVVSLDAVDERRRIGRLPQPKLPGLTAEPVLPPVAELAAKPPQLPSESQIYAEIQEQQVRQSLHNQQVLSREVYPESAEPSPSPSPLPLPSKPTEPSEPVRPAMDDPEEDPWNTPEVHKGHDHSNLNGAGLRHALANGRDSYHASPSTNIADQSLSQYVSAGQIPSSTAHGGRLAGDAVQGPGDWGFFGASNAALPGAAAPFNHSAHSHPISPGLANPFGVDGGSLDRTLGRGHASSAGAAAGAAAAAGSGPVTSSVGRATSGRTGASLEENIVVTLMPGKEGMFLFQHHNYEIASQRRGSKVIRRYSDFVWLLDCLHKRYPFRALPLLPPKRVAVNGNHLSNDGAFIEKRRRGLARFLNTVVRHPILSQEQLVIMFLTVPTELSVWRKQATISVLDEFADKALPPGLEDSLPSTLEDLFSRTRSGVCRSAELYINVCNIMDRLVKRTEGVAADHARIAMSLTSLTETSADTYATDTNEVPLLNDGLTAMSKHLRTYQTLLEDESRGWDEGVLEDLKRQRDSLVSLRELFERRDKLDKDKIPYLERRIQTNETKLAGLRSKPEGTVKPGEIEKVAEAIIKDKESIVQQHNRSVFVKECLRDELITFQSTQYHVSRWSQDWAGERVKYAEMLAENWRRLLDELEGMPLGE